ncbi:MAG: helix-turn-helix domain-containing protein [Sporichthyaceae bacterium]|jgi:excisionase family DNA binding protein
MPLRPERESETTGPGTVRPRASVDRPAFYSISDAAAMLGVSTATLYRAIGDGQFPAVRIRDRVIVPAKAIEALTDEAIDGCTTETAGPFGGAG